MAKKSKNPVTAHLQRQKRRSLEDKFVDAFWHRLGGLMSFAKRDALDPFTLADAMCRIMVEMPDAHRPERATDAAREGDIFAMYVAEVIDGHRPITPRAIGKMPPAAPDDEDVPEPAPAPKPTPSLEPKTFKKIARG